MVLPSGVNILNADDAIIAKMAELSKGEIIYFSRDPNSELIKAHQEKDGRTIIVGSNSISLFHGKTQKMVLTTTEIVKRISSEWDPDLSLAAAIGAAWALDISFNVIEAGAETFVSDANIPAGA